MRQLSAVILVLLPLFAFSAGATSSTGDCSELKSRVEQLEMELQQSKLRLNLGGFLSHQSFLLSLRLNEFKEFSFAKAGEAQEAIKGIEWGELYSKHLEQHVQVAQAMIMKYETAIEVAMTDLTNKAYPHVVLAVTQTHLFVVRNRANAVLKLSETHPQVAPHANRIVDATLGLICCFWVLYILLPISFYILRCIYKLVCTFLYYTCCCCCCSSKKKKQQKPPLKKIQKPQQKHGAGSKKRHK